MNRTNHYNTIVIGGGAAGLFYAASLDTNSDTSNARNLIIEKTGKLGTKLLLSGGGHCNISHDGSIKNFPECYGDNGKKIRTALYKYSNLSLRDFIESLGVECTVKSDGRIFPKSMNAEDVLNALIKKASSNGFEFRYKETATSISKDSSGILHLNDYTADRIVIATGGCSYPTSGSDGSFFDVLRRDLSLEVTALTPALCPLELEDYPYQDLSGISLENVKASICDSKSGKVFHTCEGPLLFTHTSFSGPAVLNISKYADTSKKLSINYLGNVTRDACLEKLKEITSGSKSSIKTLITSEFGLPVRLARMLIERSAGSLRKLSFLLTQDEYQVTSLGSFNNAMVTSGGIDLSEVDIKTFELKKHPGIYVIGEALDVDGISGGYNLQFAYSSACAAACSVNSKE